MKKPKDGVEEVEGEGQIIWCFISKGRADRKRPARKIYVQRADTRPQPVRDSVYSSEVSHDLSQAPTGTKIFQLTLINRPFRGLPEIVEKGLWCQQLT